MIDESNGAPPLGPTARTAATGTGEPATSPEQALPPANPAHIARLTATVDELVPLVEAIAKKQRSQDRSAIMLYGVLAVILWRVSAPKLAGRSPREAVADALPTS